MGSGLCGVDGARSEVDPVPVLAHAPDPLYAWISKREAAQIAEIRASLTPSERSALEGSPEDIRHDLMLCRFLRGHGHTVQRALKALRAHLHFREENRATLVEVRRRLPPCLSDFDEGLFQSRYGSLQDMMKMLQIPARCGSNDGMPLSLITIGLFHVSDMAAISDQEVRDWFICMVEMRSLCLHNQSLREGRMAKVVEVRDCHGFSWSQLWASPAALRKIRIIMQVATVYPEVLGGFVLYNIEPGLRSIALVKRLMPKEILQKGIFADRGDWKSAVCAPRALSPAALCQWAAQPDKLPCEGFEWQQVKPDRPQAVRALRVAAGDAFAWHVRCSSDLPLDCALRVAVHFFSDGPVPTALACGDPVSLAAADIAKGSFTAPATGSALLEVELMGAEPAKLLALLTLSGEVAAAAAAAALASGSMEAAGPAVSKEDKAATDASAADFLWFLAGVALAICMTWLGHRLHLYDLVR